jgi:chromosome segregation protein
LAQVGVIDPADGARRQTELAQGQRLVSTGGALWRWDGFTVTAGAHTAALVRLNQRQRLTDLRAEITASKPTVEAVRADAAAARAAAERARHAEAAARDALWTADEALRAAHETHAQVQRESEARGAKIAALGDGIVTLGIEQVDAGEGQRTAAAELTALENRHETRKTLDRARVDLVEKRRALAEIEATLEGLRRASAARAGRLRAAESERDTWTARVAEANAQTVELARRRAASDEQLALTIAKPAAIAAERQALLSTIAGAETARNRAADELALADAAHKARSDAAKAADQTLAGAREERIRRDANVSQAIERQADIERRTHQALDCTPAQAQAIAEIEGDAELPAIDQVESRLLRLQRERETMGPVNLRAEQEADEVAAKLTGMQTERADLEAAIAKLRHGIASLNREGRERLLEAFKQVDANFRTLFTQLFGGGRAHLALTEAEDPLDAGLEIMASPPGKRLQVLSLLSGGEQALTATALLVAVFQTNPAPLCVMDEVDAPLDDANVERFCNLVQAIARQTGTRFLLITHNPVTMARMDRLYGVTMAEQGVSQLVSVDLTRAEALRQTA